jgi:uroporphyrinogen decarboxylase
MNTGPVLSFDMIEEFYFPFLRSMISLIHSKGVFVDYHCDGDNTLLFPKFIEMGVDSVNALEKCGGRQDIYKLKEKYGDRLAFRGNIDVGEVLTRGTKEDVIKDVQEHIRRLSPGGGYTCSSSHDISHLVPVENFITMIETIHKTRGVVSR